MTFKDLKLQLSKLQSNTNQDNRLDIFRNKPFWIWDKEHHKKEYQLTNGKCCLNHILQCPINQKTGLPNPMFDYEKTIYDTLQQHKHIFILKSTGLGITEFFLRYIAWLCLKDDTLKNSQICIVTGPRIELAITLIDRLKKLFHYLNIYPENKETVLELNGVRIEAFPSHHLNTMRGLPNVSFILLDEGDYLPIGQQQEVRDVSERYIGKSNPFIVYVSIPNAPGGLFEKIEQEPEETCIYRRLSLDYTYGLDRIFTREEIEEAKKSPSFEREYNLKYLGLIGNTFHTKDIDRAIELGESYDPDLIVQDTQKVLGINPGWGSSAFGLVLLEFIDGCIQVRYAEEFERPRYEDMTSKILGILRGLNQWSLNQTELAATKIYIDAANPEFISSLKRAVGEWDKWSYVKDKLEYCKKYNLNPLLIT